MNILYYILYFHILLNFRIYNLLKISHLNANKYNTFSRFLAQVFSIWLKMIADTVN